MQQNFPLNRDAWEAMSIAIAAGKLILEARETGFTCETKGDSTLVTSADYQADQYIAERLMAAFPDDEILSEESGKRGPEQSTVAWIVDPLDGTQAFAGGIDTFTVLLGRMSRGVPALGVVHFPVSGESYVAEHGKGAYCLTKDGVVRALDQGIQRKPGLALSPSTPGEVRLQIRAFSGLECGPNMYGAGAKFMSVARGEASAYVSGHPLSLWDVVAPWVIVREAGGTLTNEEGREIQFPEENIAAFVPTRIVATIGEKHSDICQAVRNTRRSWSS